MIDGKSIALAGPGEQVKVNIGNDGSFVQLGVETATASSVARSAAFVHLVGVGDFSLAEAVVSRSANPCAGATGFLPAVQACPTGSDYDPVKQDCAITAFTKQPIIVGTPFNTPTGGSVVAVGHARSTVAADHCLGRHGPSYVLVGSARDGGLIQATKGADRVVALGASFTIEGAGGNDCISFAGGSDTIHDGNGRVQVFGGSANDTIGLGNGRDRIKLGAGNHDVKVGNGNDVITAGPGITKLFAGHGNNRVTLSLGLSIVRLGGGNNFVRGGPGHQDIRVANGNNFIRAATGSAQIKAGDGNNRIIAGAGVDLITAGHGKNVITSGIGFDKILARGPGARVSCIDHARVTVNPAAAAFALAHKCTNVFTAS